MVSHHLNLELQAAFLNYNAAEIIRLVEFGDDSNMQTAGFPGAMIWGGDSYTQSSIQTGFSYCRIFG